MALLVTKVRVVVRFLPAAYILRGLCARVKARDSIRVLRAVRRFYVDYIPELGPLASFSDYP